MSWSDMWYYRAGLSKFFGIPLVPGLVQSQVGKSGTMMVKSRFYSFLSKTEKNKAKF